MSRNLSELVREHIEDAIERHRMGEEFWWDFVPNVMMTQNGPMPIVMLFLYGKSPLLGGDPIVATITSGNALKMIDPDQADAAVKQAIDTILQQRSAIISGSNGNHG